MKYPLLILVSITSLSADVFAGDMKIKPGKWEFRSTSSVGGAPGMPREHVNTECITSAKMNPALLMKNLGDSCELLNANSDGKSMSWNVKCANPGGDMTGKGEVRSHGDTLKGKMAMKMSFNGQEMAMNMDWDGRYLGDCN